MKLKLGFGLLLFCLFPCTAYPQKLALDRWHYIQADNDRQKWGDFDSPEWLRYFGLDFGDVNRDGYSDIVSGRYVYLNPGGEMTLPWKRFDLGMNVDGYLFADIDGDEYADIIAEAFPHVYWFEAKDRNGSQWTNLIIGEVPATDHVNAQGGGLARLMGGDRPQIVLATGGGVFAAAIPSEPEILSGWKFTRIIPVHFDEGIAFEDFDMDGDLDVTTGDTEEGATEGLSVNWWENRGSLDQPWKAHTVGQMLHWADRFKAADLDGDKWPDIIVSEERYPGPDPDANLVWFENPQEIDGKWIKHSLLTAYSLNNLDAADADADGDIDLVTNEHKGKVHKLFLLENDGKGNFNLEVADTGKECHLGARFIDLDSDGDPDIVGHAWDKYQDLHIWRNDAILNQQPGVIFEKVKLSETVALHPNICDIDKDGFNDLVCVADYVDANGDDGMHVKSVGYFKGPDFLFTTVSRMNFRSCEMHTADINGDGYPDIIGRDDPDANDTNETGMVFWLENPGTESTRSGEWARHELGHASYTKDINDADFNRDGKTDIVARAADGKLHIFLQQSPFKWIVKVIEIPLHDGMAIADIDGDNDQDIAMNGFWLETPAEPATGTWISHDFSARWYSRKTGKSGKWWDNNTKVTTLDMNRDGHQDILISQAESSGWPVCWYENSQSGSGLKWTEHIVGYVDYCHTLQAADADNDGDPDIFCGELIPFDDQRSNPYHPVILFVNKGNGKDWDRQELDSLGCYGGKAGDLDNDGDIDLVSPRNYDRGPLNLWLNQTITSKP